MNTEIDDARPAANPAYSLPARRLAGSAQCRNCGTPLQGPFCHHCGQPDRNFMRFFPVLLREFIEDFLDLDSRFARTLKPLLFKPGRLTRDYLEGRRFRYTPPMRLYLMSSIVFFLLAATLSRNAIDAGELQINGGDALIGQESSEGPGEPDEEEFSFRFNDEPWDPVTNPVVIPFLPGSFNRWVNEELEKSPQKTAQIRENPNLIVEKILDLLPGTVFVLLPVVALIFKFWYLFARRFYIEHLIFSLHNHAFIFVCLLLFMLLEMARDAFLARGMGLAESTVAMVNLAIWIWMPLYLLLSLRQVYRQNWFLTLGKYAVIGITYLLLLGMVTSMVAMLGFLLV